MDKDRPTSIKGILQRLGPLQPGLIAGTVISISPLSIALAGEDKIVLDEDDCYVLDYLKDQKVDVVIDGTASGSVSTSEGSGSIKSLKYTGTMTIKQGLKVGDQVHILSLNEGKQYIVLGRV